MSSAENAALIGAFIAVILAIITPFFTGRENRRQDREKARHEYIDRNVNALIDLRGELQYYQLQWHYVRADEETRKELLKEYGTTIDKLDRRKMEIDFAKAYARMISIDIEGIRNLASLLMEENVSPNQKLKNIDEALKQLGEKYSFFDNKKEEDKSL